MPWPRRLRVVGVLLAFGAAQGILIFVYLKVEDSRRTSEGSLFRYERVSRRPGPDLVLLRPDGSTRKLTELRGKTVLLHFWATWCPPCREELPGLLWLGRDLTTKGRLQVVAISLDTDWAAVREFFGGDVPPEVVRDGLGAAADTYGVSTLPESYLLAPDGSIRIRFGGARNWRTQDARDALLLETNPEDTSREPARAPTR